MKNFKIIFIVLFLINLQATAQVNITAAGPTDICNGYVILNVDNPLPGIVYDWYVFSFTCTGVVQSGPLSSGVSFGAGFSGDFYCIATDTSSGGQVASNDIPIRVLPGSMNSTMLPAPYPVNVICFGDTVTLCVPSDLYQTFFTTIAWYRNNIMINGASLDTYVTALSGWYKYSITSPCMTAFSDSVLITSPITPVITGSTSFCQGSCTVLTGGPGFASYLWSNGSTAMSIQVCLPGQYTLWVTDFYGCTYTVTVSITVYPNPVPLITGDSTLCSGQTAILDAGAGYMSYWWSIGGAITQTYTVNTIGNYTVTVTDANGCSGTDNIQVTGLEAIMSGDASICQGMSTNIIIDCPGGTAPFSYTYSNGIQTFGPFATANMPASINVSPTVTTVYTVISFDDANCAAFVSGSATITVNPIPIPNITGDTTLCPGQSTILDAGGYAVFLWNTGDVTQTITVNAIGTYTVIVTDSNGCIGSDDITLIAAPPYATVLSTSGPLGICLGDSVQLTAPGAMSSYQWYKNNVLMAGATNQSIWISTAGRYKCLSTDNQNCPAESNQLRVRIVCFPPDPPDEKVQQFTGTTKLYQVQPNPSSNNFIVQGNEIGASKITITNSSGQMLPVKYTIDSDYQISVSGLRPGIYFMKIENTSGTEIHKIVKIE